MIKQCAITDIESRSQCNPYDKTGFLPIITSNMYSVVDKTNAHIFLQNKIKVCMPRKEYMDDSYSHCSNENYFDSYSLSEFVENFIDTNNGFLTDKNDNILKTSICIDTAAGHLKKLHDAIRKAKEIHGDRLIIMAGNVSSVDAFVELAKTGVDYIRVGIGGGGGCNTTSNTGVGQENLENLINDCKFRIDVSASHLYKYHNEGRFQSLKENKDLYNELLNISKVKIVADGISSYIKQCQTKYGFNDNGYAAINKLLFAGADLVMIGKLFAQCLESAGEKRIDTGDEVVINHSKIKHLQQLFGEDIQEQVFQRFRNGHRDLVVKYSGMSTHVEQEKYKSEFYWKWWWGDSILGTVKDETVFYDFNEMKTHSSKHSFENSITKQNYYSNYTKHKNTKPSEGSVQWIPIRWTLSEWLNGSDKQDEAPYLMGWINSIKSAMAYTGKTTL